MTLQAKWMEDAKTVWAENNQALLLKATQEEIDAHWATEVSRFHDEAMAVAIWLQHPTANAILNKLRPRNEPIGQAHVALALHILRRSLEARLGIPSEHSGKLRNSIDGLEGALLVEQIEWDDQPNGHERLQVAIGAIQDAFDGDLDV